jgi:dihydroorotase
VTDTITIRRPDDWHVHLREGDMLVKVVPWTARQFARAIVMPNLKAPVTTVAQAVDYRTRIVAAAGGDFEPLMTAYLTDTIAPDELKRGHSEGVWVAAKLYPAGATTNSDSGVTDIANIRVCLETMQDIGMVLCIHGEATSGEIDVFDREEVFIERTLAPLVRDFPGLKVVLEHITTRQAVEFVADAPANVAATITPQHLHLNRNALFVGGLRPHAYCLPVVKREEHRLAVRKAAVSGSPKFFLGTDSAPHTRGAKESDCGCAGIYNAPYALESYTTVFDEEGAIGNLEGFASHHGADFYGLPRNTGTVTLERAAMLVPAEVDGLVPFHAGEALPWRFVEDRG